MEFFISSNQEYEEPLAIDLVEANLHLSDIYQELGDLDRAETTTKEAIDMVTRRSVTKTDVMHRLWLQLGTIHYRKQDVVDALACFDRAINDVDINTSNKTLISTAADPPRPASFVGATGQSPSRP